MLRGVNAATLALILAAVAAACRKAEPPAARTAAADAVSVVARVVPATDAGSAGASVAAGPELLREESARFLPEEYRDLWIGESREEMLAAYPEARPYAAPSDPERLEWFELEGERGLIVRLGFGATGGERKKELRSIQFLSLLQAPASTKAPATPRAIAAWRDWFEQAYRPYIAALREKYGEKAEVYTCGGGMAHPIVRIVWRGRALAVTAVFMLHDKGLSTTLMLTPIAVVERYLRATQCVLVQDRVL